MMHKVSITGVMLDQASKVPIVVLKNLMDERTIPIGLGISEASAIACAVQNIKFDRPMTHDLFKNFVSMLDISIYKVELTDILDNTYYAKIYFLAKDEILNIDARPSDAIAMALRFDAPIFVDEKVFNKAQAMPAPAGSFGLESLKNQNEFGDKEKNSQYLMGLPESAFGKYKV